MHNLPESFNNHPFFRTIKSEMSEKALTYKHKIDNYSTLEKKEKFTIFRELLDIGFSWPDPLRQEGFWCDNVYKDNLFKEFPYPKENQIEQNEIAEFISKLAKVESKAQKFSYLGYSECRICGKQNGNKTYYSDLFAWPEGYRHYIKEHGVKPSAAFVLHIRGLIT